MENRHIKSFIVLLALVVVINSYAQPTKSSTLWIEAGLAYSTSTLQFHGISFADDANVMLGLNKKISERTSWGVMVYGGFHSGIVPALGNHGGRYQQATVALIPNITFNYPISHRLHWVPRLFLSLGYSELYRQYYDSDGGPMVSYASSSLPLEIGVKTCSFDFEICDRFSINLTYEPLNLLIGYEQYLSGSGMRPIHINIPSGKVSLSEGLSNKALVTFDARIKL